MNELEELKERIASVFLKEIIKSLRDDEITVDESKAFAVEFLAMEPYTSVDDARAKIHTFAEKNSRFGALKTYIDAYKDEQNTNRVIALMKKHLQNDEVDEALEVARKKDT